MRFKLTLKLQRDSGNCLPLNYQYEQSAAIYRILSRANEDFTKWLHDNGYKLSTGKNFKLFSYSRFGIEKYRIHKETAQIEILSNSVEWIISFLPEVSTEKFIQGIFNNQQFEVGNRQSTVSFEVQSIEMLSQPDFSDTMTYNTLSPICITLKREDSTFFYIPPDHPDAERLVKLNLLEKFIALNGKDFPKADFPFKLKILSEPKSSLITIKAGTPEQSKIRGYMCKFQLTAPIELQKIMYDSGCAGKNSVGFGMVEVGR